MLWQPIETAPKDGTCVLVCAPQGTRFDGTPFNPIHVARWASEDHEGGYGHKWRTADYQGLGSSITGRPSHWMPLPPQPKS